MLKSLKIRNFQSHELTFMKFVEGVNVIVGQSDSGKTAIIRALRWLVFNRPSGEAFRSNWGGETEVRANFEEAKIQRTRDKHNTYKVNGVELEAIGQNVPDEVSGVVNLGELNLQHQMDAPFLLSSSPGEVARTLNEVASLEVIDKALANVNRMMRSNKQKLKSTDEHLKQLKTDLEQFDYLEDADKDLTALEKQKAELQSIVLSLQKLSDTIGLVDSAQEQLEASSPILKAEGKIEKLDKAIEEANSLDEQVDELKKLGIQISKNRKLVTEAAKLTNAETQLAKIEKLEEEAADIDVSCCRLEGRIDHMAEREVIIEKLQAEISTLEEQLPEVCPTCGTELK